MKGSYLISIAYIGLRKYCTLSMAYTNSLGRRYRRAHTYAHTRLCLSIYISRSNLLINLLSSFHRCGRFKEDSPYAVRFISASHTLTHTKCMQAIPSFHDDSHLFTTILIISRQLTRFHGDSCGFSLSHDDVRVSILSVFTIFKRIPPLNQHLSRHHPQRSSKALYLA